MKVTRISLLIVFFGASVISGCNSTKEKNNPDINIQPQQYGVFRNSCGPDDGRTVEVVLAQKPIDCNSPPGNIPYLKTYLQVSSTNRIRQKMKLSGYAYGVGGKTVKYPAFYCKKGPSNCKELGQLEIEISKVTSKSVKGKWRIIGGPAPEGDAILKICKSRPKFCG